MLERAWFDAINRGDAAVIAHILADDFRGIDQAGRPFDKPAAVRDPPLGAFLTGDVARLEEVEARAFGDTAVATSRLKLTDSAARGVITHVYIQRRGRWQCIASHASWAAGSVCPAVGPIAERDSSPARIPARPSKDLVGQCLSCHTVERRDKPQAAPPGSFPRIPIAPPSIRDGDAGVDERDGDIRLRRAGEESATRDLLRWLGSHPAREPQG
jgi:ketosteroid isomerase-like protein